MFSQQDEERYILEALSDAPTGRLLDIGAYNPKVFSNTRALFDLGWSGVMIEPSPGPMHALLKEYGEEPRITLIQAAVSLERGLVRMRVTDDAVSSSEAATIETWKDAGGYLGWLHVSAIALEDIANQFGGFDFVNVDAEGVSVDLFKRMLEMKWEPRCFCVEHDGRSTELLAAATGAGYSCTYANATNVVLVRK